VFPSESYIRVVWIGLKGDGFLKKLQKEIEKKLEEFHFRKDFEFLPHLTLARVKFVSDKDRFISSLKKIEVEEKELEVKEFKLIKSTLTREGPVYEDVGVFSQSL
jgi:2'-5' RNA ligase